jgi:hypothetical protein
LHGHRIDRINRISADVVVGVRALLARNIRAVNGRSWWLGSKSSKCQIAISICIDLNQILHWNPTHLGG